MLPYEDYRQMGGSVADETLYARLSARAAQIIHRATHGRLRDADPPDCVRYCAYELIELLAADHDADAMLGGIAAGREVTAMSNDGMSITFSSSGSSGNGAGGSSGNLQARCMGVVREWLDGATDANGVHLLYAGVDA